LPAERLVPARRCLNGKGASLWRLALEPAKIKYIMDTALRTPEIRRACFAVERVLGAVDLLDNLPPNALEAVRDYCTDYIKGRTGTFSAFKHAWIDMVVDHLNDQRMTERRLFHGITGATTDTTLEKHALKKA
jgi:hypothetical protein